VNWPEPGKQIQGADLDLPAIGAQIIQLGDNWMEDTAASLQRRTAGMCASAKDEAYHTS
jgi:hypothetical protein